MRNFFWICCEIFSEFYSKISYVCNFSQLQYLRSILENGLIQTKILNFVPNFGLNFVLKFVLNFVPNFALNFSLKFVLNFVPNFVLNFVPKFVLRTDGRTDGQSRSYKRLASPSLKNNKIFLNILWNINGVINYKLHWNLKR